MGIEDLSKHRYRGCEVWYSYKGGEWMCLVDSRPLMIMSLPAVYQAIDYHLKREDDFEPFEVIDLTGEREERQYEVLNVTLISADNLYWVINKWGNRTKVDPRGLTRNTPENQALILKIKEVDANAAALTRQASQLRESIQIVRDEPEEDGE